MKAKLLSCIVTAVVALTFAPAITHAQTLAVKTNVLADATTTLNLGAEVRLAPKWTLDISGNYNPWEFSDYRKEKHWTIQPEARYWFCEAFNGHFLAAHVIGGEFNMSDPLFPFNYFEELKDYRYQGWMYGAGVGYGYQWILSPRWSLEAEIGVGWVGTTYEKYQCGHCGELLGTGTSSRFTITKLSMNIIYLLF